MTFRALCASPCSEQQTISRGRIIWESWKPDFCHTRYSIIFSLSHKWLGSSAGGGLPIHSTATLLHGIFLQSTPLAVSCPFLQCRNKEAPTTHWVALTHVVSSGVLSPVPQHCMEGRIIFLVSTQNTLRCGFSFSSNKRNRMLWGTSSSLHHVVFIQGLWCDLRKLGRKLWQNQVIFQPQPPASLGKGAFSGENRDGGFSPSYACHSDLSFITVSCYLTFFLLRCHESKCAHKLK